MELDSKTSQEESMPTETDWAQIRNRVKQAEDISKKFATSVYGYLAGGSMYEHFYVNEMHAVYNVLNGRANRTLKDAYAICTRVLGQMERYHRLMQSSAQFTKTECTQIHAEYFNKFSRYLDDMEKAILKKFTK